MGRLKLSLVDKLLNNQNLFLFFRHFTKSLVVGILLKALSCPYRTQMYPCLTPFIPVSCSRQKAAAVVSGQSRRQVGAMATFAQVRTFCSLTVREYGLNKYSHAASGRVDTSHNTEAKPFLSRTLKK